LKNNNIPERNMENYFSVLLPRHRSKVGTRRN